jgi:transcriptional regulator with XRE-family HTH domain
MFPKILRELRLEQNLTQSEMARALNISRVAYTNYELGNREPDFSTMTHIAKLLGTTLDYLLGNSPVRDPVSAAKLYKDEYNYADLPNSLRGILLRASDLSNDSLVDLENFIDLLKLRENPQKEDIIRKHYSSPPPSKHLYENHGKNDSARRGL